MYWLDKGHSLQMKRKDWLKKMKNDNGMMMMVTLAQTNAPT